MAGSPPEFSDVMASGQSAGINQVQVSSAMEQEVVELFDKLRDPLLRYLLGLSVAITDSEDIVQEAFLALFEHLRNGKSRHHLRGWLFRVVHNLARKDQQRIQLHSRKVRESMSAAENSVICPAPNPEDQLVASQAREHIRAVLQALPEQNRWCLYLRAEGFRYREIAEILDISLGSVSAYLERSLAHIARAVKR